MPMRVAMIGYGAVGSIHAAKLRQQDDVQVVSVYGPTREKAVAFASAQGIPRACRSISEGLEGADAAIICSPSAAHFAQARECLEHGVHTLVEMPPCENAAEAEALANIARRRGVKLGCAHTSRFVAPFLRIKKCLESGTLGAIQAFNYARYHQLRERSWRDNALLHHCAHPLDLLFYWCGGLAAQGCVALPDAQLPQTVSLLGRLPSGGAAAITVTYAARLYQIGMMIVGEKHTVTTDGFTYIRSDLPELEFHGIEQQTYEEAVHLQDAEFLRACQGKSEFVSWEETLKVLDAIDRFRVLAA
jgi:2-hydroxy-4-carboxymuconate semialdehyde hemiacetal dehydrogenase